jgi:hypothetical protein
MRLPYRSAFDSPLTRLRVPPEDPAAIVGPRPRGTRRPHTDATVAAVRALIEQTTLTYGQIAQKTGVGRASICRWTRDQGWVRPVFAPRATDTVPRPRASAQLKRRLLAGRLQALAERYVAELEAGACVDPDRLAQALELVKMAKLAAMTRRRRRPRRDDAVMPSVPAPQRNAPSSPVVPAQDTSSPVVPAQAGTHNPGAYESANPALAELRAAGIDPACAPQTALQDFIASRKEPEDFPELRPRGRRSRRNREHARLLEK